MGRSVREIERKYAVDVLVVPDLDGVPGVATVDDPVSARLDATYVDTADLSLASRGVTLRRRTGGSDAGWHLKLPAGPDTRDEIHEPVGRTARTVPPRLRALVAAYARGKPLVPVARVRTDRTERTLRGADGTVLASVTGDEVHAQRLTGDTAILDAWCEIEVELVEGDRRLLEALEARVLAVGATPSDVGSKALRVLGDGVIPPWPATATPLRKRSPAGDVVAAYLREQTAAVLAWDPRVRLDEGDSVHKMRVATRRMRSALRTFRPLLDEAAVADVGTELRWLAAELGTVRDGEVLHARLRAAVDALPPELVMGPVAGRLQTDVLAPTLAAREALLGTLSGDRYLALLDRLDAVCAQPPLLPAAQEPARDVLPALLARVLRTTRRRLQAAVDVDEQHRDVALHEARKTAKRLRYAAEAVGEVVGTRAARIQAAAEQVQEVLGERQDAVIAADELRRVGLRAHAAGENAFTYGLLVGSQRQQGRAVEAQVTTLLDALDDPRLRLRR